MLICLVNLLPNVYFLLNAFRAWQSVVPTHFHWVEMRNVNIPTNVSFCGSQKKVSHNGSEQHEGGINDSS